MIDLRALALPVYDADLEAASGVPDGARRLRDAIAAADAVLIVTPEYNGFPTPLLINAFDWLSRLQAAGDVPSGLATTAGKPVALLSSSPGPAGGLRAMNFRTISLELTGACMPATCSLTRQGGIRRAKESRVELCDPRLGVFH